MIGLDVATTTVLEARTDALAVITMSPLAYWRGPLTRADDFRLIGTMGAASAIGLGLALGRPDRDVWVLDGDGSLLMQLGVLAAIADAAPPNFTLILMDNGIYAVSGAQPVPGPIDWPAMLGAAGMRDVASCADVVQLQAALQCDMRGPRAVIARCTSERPAYPDGAFAGISSADEAARVRATLTTGSGRVK